MGTIRLYRVSISGYSEVEGSSSPKRVVHVADEIQKDCIIEWFGAYPNEN